MEEKEKIMTELQKKKKKMKKRIFYKQMSILLQIMQEIFAKQLQNV
jgi:hypothetical protein